MEPLGVGRFLARLGPLLLVELCNPAAFVEHCARVVSGHPELVSIVDQMFVEGTVHVLEVVVRDEVQHVGQHRRELEV